LATLCGVSPRTIDYYTRRGLLQPSERSRGRQRRYDEAAIQQLLCIKELQSERLTLREITQRLAAGAPASPVGLTAQVQALEDELERLNRSLASLTPRLQATRDPAERQAVCQVASLALAKSLALAQWFAAIVRDGQTSV
jgi:DNA-binding transcriptional MerR regulator